MGVFWLVKCILSLTLIFIIIGILNTMQEFPVRALYAQAALLAHDCIGNTFITVDNNKQLKVYASIDIRAGEIIYNCYTASLYVSFDYLFLSPSLYLLSPLSHSVFLYHIMNAQTNRLTNRHKYIYNTSI